MKRLLQGLQSICRWYHTVFEKFYVSCGLFDMPRFYEDAELAKTYVNYRPHYTEEVAKIVMKFYQSQQNSDICSSELDLMVDVGCGSGQSTNIFHSYFKNIIGVDVSREQLNQAQKQNVHANIAYLEGDAENIPVKDHSVDLITAATCVHWFDMEKFCKEVKRVLKPSGCLAILCFSDPKIVIPSHGKLVSEKADELFINTILTCSDSLPNAKAPYRHIIIHRYMKIFESLPFKNKLRDDSYRLIQDVCVEDIFGYMRSLGPYHTYMSNYRNSKGDDVSEEDIALYDPLEKLKTAYNKLLNISEDLYSKTAVQFHYECFVLLAKPSME